MISSKARLKELIREYSFREGDFTLASGKKSTYYVDVRKTSLTAEGAALIGECLLDAILDAEWKFDAIGGMTMGADPLTTAVALTAYQRKCKTSCFLVRKEAKGHGAGNRVESGGDLPAGAEVVLLEDTVTTGGSTISAADAVIEAGYRIVGAACVVDRCEGGREALMARGIPLVSLFVVADLQAGSHAS